MSALWQLPAAAIAALIQDVRKKWKVDAERFLLTGISDGGTFALAACLQSESPFSAFAVVAGTLPPGDLRMARGRRIYWAHGANDWMFPINVAKRSAQVLEQAAADVTLHVIHDLSHTYPRDENARILAWFDPSLSLAV